MTAPDSVFFVKFSIKGRVLFCYKVLFCLIPLILQRSAYNLFYFSVMYINAWSEFHLLYLRLYMIILILSYSIIFSLSLVPKFPIPSRKKPSGKISLHFATGFPSLIVLLYLYFRYSRCRCRHLPDGLLHLPLRQLYHLLLRQCQLPRLPARRHLHCHWHCSDCRY